MAYADYIHCTECDCKVVYYIGHEDKQVLCSDCLKKYREMITDFLHAWKWWKERMIKKYGAESKLITEENCIQDWVTINWAWEYKDVK